MPDKAKVSGIPPPAGNPTYGLLLLQGAQGHIRTHRRFGYLVYHDLVWGIVRLYRDGASLPSYRQSAVSSDRLAALDKVIVSRPNGRLLF